MLHVCVDVFVDVWSSIETKQFTRRQSDLCCLAHWQRQICRWRNQGTVLPMCMSTAQLLFSVDLRLSCNSVILIAMYWIPLFQIRLELDLDGFGNWNPAGARADLERIWWTCFRMTERLKECIALNETRPITELRDVTCRMGSYSVTFYPTQVNASRLNPCQ